MSEQEPSSRYLCPSEDEAVEVAHVYSEPPLQT